MKTKDGFLLSGLKDTELLFIVKPNEFGKFVVKYILLGQLGELKPKEFEDELKDIFFLKDNADAEVFKQNKLTIDNTMEINNVRITNIIERQLQDLLILGLEPEYIILTKGFYDEFINECKTFIKASNDKVVIENIIVNFKGLKVKQMNLENIHFNGIGILSPIQITIKNKNNG